MIDELDRLIAECRAIGARRRELAKTLGGQRDRGPGWHEAASRINELRTDEGLELDKLSALRTLALSSVRRARKNPEAVIADAQIMVREARALTGKTGGDR
jgi:hypothetical protein